MRELPELYTLNAALIYRGRFPVRLSHITVTKPHMISRGLNNRYSPGRDPLVTLNICGCSS